MRVDKFIKQLRKFPPELTIGKTVKKDGIRVFKPLEKPEFYVSNKIVTVVF